MTQVLWELLWLLRGLHAKWSCWLWVKAISVCFLLILSTFSNVAAVQLPVDLLLILIFTWSFFPAAVTPFEVFVFSDASPVTADMSTASGFIFVCLVFNCKPLFDIFCVHQYKNGLLIASSCFYIIKCVSLFTFYRFQAIKYARRQPSTFYGIEIGKK